MIGHTQIHDAIALIQQFLRERGYVHPHDLHPRGADDPESVGDFVSLTIISLNAGDPEAALDALSVMQRDAVHVQGKAN